MNIWDETLTRDNFDSFYKTFSPAAYKSTYRLLGDTTRTERVLVDSFISLYQRRKDIPAEELPHVFGNILQEKIDHQLELYSVREAPASSQRSLDEFTQSSILLEIHNQIDSLSYHFIELFFNNSGPRAKENDPPLKAFFRSSGLSIMNFFQFILLALIIFAVTALGMMTFVDNSDLIPKSPDASSYSVADLIVGAMEFYPLKPDAAPPPEA